MSEPPAAQSAASPIPSGGVPLSDSVYQLSAALVATTTQGEVLRAVLRCALSPLGALSGAALMVQGDGLHRVAFEAVQLEAGPSEAPLSGAAALWQGGPLSASSPAADSLRGR